MGEKFKQIRPKYIIYTNIISIYNSKTNKFEVNTGDCISVLDGFINIDFTFNYS